MSLLEQNQKIVAQYRESGQTWPASSTEIARWAIEKKLWQIHPGAVVRQCADQIATAMREVFFTDPQGRRVRLLHPAPYRELGKKQYLLWDDMRTASHKHMRMAFQQRRQGIVMDCQQLKMDVDSYNDNYNNENPIQLILDFSPDIAELEIMAQGIVA